MITWRVILASIWFGLSQASGSYGESYGESLTLRPLARNTLLSTFEFQVESAPIGLEYHNESMEYERKKESRNYKLFPKTFEPIIEGSNVRELHMRFAQGWWDPQSWGKLPMNGTKSGGTGVEIWAAIEASNLEDAKRSWFKLTNSLSGLFCVSLNFIDNSITTSPRYRIEARGDTFVLTPGNQVYLLRASLPSEPICTENLTPFLKLLPTRGKAGVSSLLDGHKVFDSLWHGISLDINTVCTGQNGANCHLVLDQSIVSVVDVMRLIRRKEGGGIPKPTPGDKLRCDESKAHDVWQCFPLSDPTELTWDTQTLFGRSLKGAAFEGDVANSEVKILIDKGYWNVEVQEKNDGEVSTRTLESSDSNLLQHQLQSSGQFNFIFNSSDTSKIAPKEEPPLYVSRSLTGYSQDRGGLRVSIFNPTSSSIDFVYSETLPWFMRAYMSTFTLDVRNSTGTYLNVHDPALVKLTYFKPAIDRKRPSQLELTSALPANSALTFNYDFDKSLLLYAEYPPDANHGFAVEPAVISVMEAGKIAYELRTTSLLLTLPTPDFSMPYNVIILTCTVMSLAFGSIFNLLTKKTITEEELEEMASEGKLTKVIRRLKLMFKVKKS